MCRKTHFRYANLIIIGVLSTLLGACFLVSGKDRSIPQNLTLTATARTPSEIYLNWSPDIIDNFWFSWEHYKIKRNGVDLGVWTQSSIYIDKNLEPLTRYCYIIYAIAGDPFDRSNEACVETPGLAGWTIETIDIGASPALALDSSNQPHVSYRNSSGVILAYKNVDSWLQSVVDGGAGIDGDTDVVIDSFSAAHLSYTDDFNDRLMYASNTTGVWQTEVADTVIGMTNALSIGTSNNIHIAYNSAPPNSGLVNYMTNTSGSWQKESIGGTEGDYRAVFDADILVDTAGVTHAVFVEGRTGSSHGSVYYNNNQGGTWGVSQVICSMCLGDSGAAMAIDSAGNIHIAYYQQLALMHAYNTGGNWQYETLDSFYDYIDTIASASARAGLVIDGADRLHIAYRDYNDDLKYITNVSGTWRRYFIDVNGNVGGDPSITVDPTGRVSIAYTDLTNDTVKLATSP